MPSAMSGENIKLTCPLCHELWKMVLSILFSYIRTNMTTINVWERIGEKHLVQLVAEGACQPDIFTKYRLGCELSYGTYPISLCTL